MIALWILGGIVMYLTIGLYNYRREYRVTRVIENCDVDTSLTNARMAMFLWPIWMVFYVIPQWLTKIEPLIIPSTQPDRQAEIEALKKSIENLEKENSEAS